MELFLFWMGHFVYLETPKSWANVLVFWHGNNNNNKFVVPSGAQVVYNLFAFVPIRCQIPQLTPTSSSFASVLSRYIPCSRTQKLPYNLQTPVQRWLEFNRLFCMGSLPFWYRVRTFHCPICDLKREHWFVLLFLLDLLKTLLNSEWSGRPPLWSSGQSSWLQIQRSRVRFLPDFLRNIVGQSLYRLSYPGSLRETRYMF
jgi:hypothetical protein